jgi:hypothetical protein
VAWDPAASYRSGAAFNAHGQLCVVEKEVIVAPPVYHVMNMERCGNARASCVCMAVALCGDGCLQTAVPKRLN